MNDNIIFRECEVLMTENLLGDNKGGLRIKVRIQPDDNDCEKIEDLPYCYPLMPKHFHINPKQGEMVLVVLGTMGVLKGRRWFIGPIISQQYALNYDPFKYSARSLLDNGIVAAPLPRPDLNPDNKGTYPDQDDIALQGRQNADLILKDQEVRLRCGFKREPNGVPKNTLLFNKEDLSYIQMKYVKNGIVGKNERRFSSVINVVADRINLLSHDGKRYYKLNDPEALIPDSEIAAIDKTAHPLVYGDELITYLKKLIDVIRTHTHPFSMDPPCFTEPQLNTLDEDLDIMLSETVKIN